MLSILNIILSFIAGYLIGSIPTGYIFGRLYKGIDIREFGSGNLGATNAMRVLGKVPGIIVLVIDVLKGVVVITLVASLFGITHAVWLTLLSLTVVAGHNWTIFLKFKGGKGIATTLGVMIGLAIKIEGMRLVLGLSLLIWLVIFLGTGYVSLASIITATLLPVVMMLTSQSLELVVMGIIFCIFVVLRHRANIKRLLSGKEPRVQLFSKKIKIAA